MSVAFVSATRFYTDFCKRTPAKHNSNICETRPTRHQTTAKRADGSHPSQPGAKYYNVTVEDPKKGIVHKYSVPEDRYIWHAMDDAGADIPSSCRNGCCTTCAVKISSGSVNQKEALGLMKEMRNKGYALLCVSYPQSDLHCVLQDEDEVYVKQFGSTFESGGVEWGGVLPEDD